MPVEVYYLDDEEALCNIFAEFIGSDQVRVTTFSDAGAMIETCNNRPPDILFIDYRLPGTTGDLVAIEISEDIPKVLVTGDLTFKSRYEFDEVISKPCDYKEVKEIIDRYI